MRICIFSAQPIEDQVTGGYQERIFNLFSPLSQRGWDINIFAMDYAASTRPVKGMTIHTVAFPWIMRKLLRLTRGIAAATKSTLGAHAVASALPNILLESRKTIKASDIVIIEDPLFILPLIYARLRGKPAVLELHQLIFQYFITRPSRFKNPLNIPKSLVVAVFEVMSCLLASKIIVVHEGDKKNLHRFLRISNEKISVIQNGVDVDIARSHPDQRGEIRDRYGIKDETAIVTFVGNLEVSTNSSAVKYIAEKLAPKIFNSYPEGVYFMIVGRYSQLPPHFFEDRRIIFTNYVEDIAPYMNAADICIAPLEVGTGTKTKIFLYMAFEKPIITTDIGAEGIDITAGREGIITSLDSFSDELSRLIQNVELCGRLGQAAKAKVVEEYDWKKHSADLADLLATLAKQQP